MREIAPGVALVSTVIANAYLVGSGESWVLVDACTPGHEGLIQRAAARRFGKGNRPRAILLTHGHFDHAGSAGPLADLWDVPIYAHAQEIAFLTGRARYPPFNFSSPGFFTRIARFFPTGTVDLGTRVTPLTPHEAIPGLSGWEIIETPGHTPGHVSFFRNEDRVLLAGDAVTTMNLDNFFDTLARRKQVCRPPVPATADWASARKSVELLAAMCPSVIAAGHGQPMDDAAGQLAHLAENFAVPPNARLSGR
jgi:glyoxylase-like metal-dependent hydrolase (beta-lactamase superfamily II)